MRDCKVRFPSDGNQDEAAQDSISVTEIARWGMIEILQK